MREKRKYQKRAGSGQLLLFLLLALCLIQAAGAKVNVYHIAITPNTEIIGNQTPVEILALMDITSEDQYTFSPDNTLRFWTELENPVWTPLISRDGSIHTLPVRHSKAMTLNSWDLSYPSGSGLSLKVTVKGIAPNVTATQERTLIRIEEATPNSVINGSEVVRKKLITYVPGAQPPEAPYVPAGSINVSSLPDHATITLDGEYRGETPKTLEGIEVGPHTLLLSLPGYNAANLSVSVIERQTLDIFTTLQLGGGSGPVKKGVVTVISEPEGAEVIVGGVSFGKTPIYNHEGEAGIYPIQVSLAGYQPYSSEIQVIPGQLNTVMVQLYPLQPSVTGQAGATTEFTATTCCIRFSSDPPGADIYVDSRFVGITPAEICGLSPGRHKTSLMLPFYKIFEEDVNPQPGEVVDVGTSFTLDELEIPGIGMILGIFSDFKLPGLPGGGGTAPPQDSGDRQKAYEELVKSSGGGD